jgi:signal transduction histidine kinase
MAISFAVSGAEPFPVNNGGTNLSSVHWVTKVSQFETLSSADYLTGCNFQLTGVVTLVDTNRDLVVLQDDTGAVALNFRPGQDGVEVGQSVTLYGTNACPLFASFPDYPYHPSGHDIRSSFEGPANWGEYNLTRMRGFLHPPVSGDYRFWIASDNSSELWLSTDASPLNARKIASVPRLFWVDSHQWTKFPSQRSELIRLNAGETYYIEALQEQTREDEHLAVGWQIPSPGKSGISIISGDYLRPWDVIHHSPSLDGKGILREYWTNYAAGTVEHMAGERPFESALTVEQVGVHVHGPGRMPQPAAIGLGDRLTTTNNYRWVVTEGVAKFSVLSGAGALLELFNGQDRIQVHAAYWDPEKSRQLEQLTNAVVRVEGVCEGVFDLKGTLVPGAIWASAKNSVSFVNVGASNGLPLSVYQANPSSVSSNQVVAGYFETFGVVTFNDRVFGKDYVFIQEDKSAVQVSLTSSLLKNELKVGRCVSLGGQLSPGKSLQVVTPFFVVGYPPQSMPLPFVYSGGASAPSNLEGRWTEIEGVVHSANTNGTLTLVGKDGVSYVWLGQVSSNDLTRFVDARIRARGVLMPTMLENPTLLVPSRDFVDIEDEAPIDPFGMRPHSIADILSDAMDSTWPHRVRVMGQVTYCDSKSLFIQDASGGIRLMALSPLAAKLGEQVEVAAFPMAGGSTWVLTDAVVRPSRTRQNIHPQDMDLDAAPLSGQYGTLVQLRATLLDSKKVGSNQILGLQEKQRVVTATLPVSEGTLPAIVPGSRLLVTGVCDDGISALPGASLSPASAQFLAPVNILLRTPEDVVVLSGPAWWTWQKTATLIAILLATLTGAVLWIHLLRRRLERNRAAQLASSQLILGKLEEERRRIAINLHDSLGQSLLVIKHRADSPTDAQKTEHNLNEIANVASQAIDEVRRITHGLRPSQLDSLGLTQAIRALVSRASEKDTILFASRVENVDDLFEKDAEIHVYRVVQEAVTNVVKHSAATEGTVVIKKQPATVSISIRDNGRGFDPAELSTQTHDLGYGLGGIKERVRILKGTVVIDSKPGSGTSLTMEVPFRNS